MSRQVAHTTFSWSAGRRFADSAEIAYILPSDQGEVERLKINHELWNLFKSDIHEKLQQGIRVLDVGCGPGWWSRDMAALYPRSYFVGIDMADVFVTEDAPPNVCFKVMNAGTGLDFEDASFDFVFQRFLVMGLSVNQYKQSVREMRRVLKPGGAIEALELVNKYNNATSAFAKIESWMSRFLEEAGFIDIKDTNYDVPIGPWGGDPGVVFLAIQRLALPAVKFMVTQLTPTTKEEYDNTVQEAFEDAMTHQVSTRFRLIYATKPEIQHKEEERVLRDN
ncbi:S-adenosyl-L-methionine-dependent methyltransferase [Dichotomocladium elegans]|nr:S-adenosyl-L-methionine-dependent methyltransferase [Dichotomocladium elegans]